MNAPAKISLVRDPIVGPALMTIAKALARQMVARELEANRDKRAEPKNGDH